MIQMIVIFSNKTIRFHFANKSFATDSQICAIFPDSDLLEKLKNITKHFSPYLIRAIIK
jgi:hypothetical protein